MKNSTETRVTETEPVPKMSTVEPDPTTLCLRTHTPSEGLDRILREVGPSDYATETSTTRVVASAPTPDRYEDIVDGSDWRLETFKNNPVIQWAHDYSIPPVGRAVSVEVVNGILVADIEWDES